ncbi:hypothetical protein [Novosphingobium mangrovi (ex Huang et al. 2023)]|uniref:Uncharacterized protein n=1 Tax=Novosphingobium mangrovi (ex Huang et al. 2023) TaxID=2976432 RepID=A0ABT2I724_9SPHN|nr:hypothetical protein [Novosphingobium mangrovi (ex Huang et al. 2023)]MCT2400601.1 hypothetical protein [Novosphingobium mangrovi (ex Huang et al. 2023)]
MKVLKWTFPVHSGHKNIGEICANLREKWPKTVAWPKKGLLYNRACAGSERCSSITSPSQSNLTFNPVIARGRSGGKISGTPNFQKAGILEILPLITCWPSGQPIQLAISPRGGGLRNHHRFRRSHGSPLPVLIGFDASQAPDTSDLHQPPSTNPDRF